MRQFIFNYILVMTVIILSGCTSVPSVTTDIAKMGLKGSVASISDTYFKVLKTSTGEFETGDLLGGTHNGTKILPYRKISFNKEGFWTEIVNLDSAKIEDQRFEYIYRDEKLVEEKGYCKGTMIYHNIYRFDGPWKVYSEYNNFELDKRWIYEDRLELNKLSYRYRTNPDGNMDKLLYVYLDNGNFKLVPEDSNKISAQDPVLYYNTYNQVTRVESPKELWEYCYDEQGRMCKVLRNGELSMEYEYDSDGNLVRLFGFHTYPYMKGSNRTYRYKYTNFDEQGNWHTCYEYYNNEKSPRMVQQRQIVYY